MPRVTPTKLRQCWWLAFILGFLMINYPFLQICNRPLFLFGVPLMVLYLFVGWAASIAVIALYAWALGKQGPEGEG